MFRKPFILFLIVALIGVAGCVKETYDMNMLSKKAHISPTFAISAARGDISFSDLVEPSDTVVFDENNFVTIVFKKDSVINLDISDFVSAKSMNNYISLNPGFDYEKGSTQMEAILFDPDTINFGTEEILNHINGDFLISNPSVKLNYTNSFVDPIQVFINASGKRNEKTINLNLAPFILEHPADSIEPEVSSSVVVDKNNSKLDSLISIPPYEIYLSGTAVMDYSGKKTLEDSKFTGNRSFLASIEVEIPLEFRIKNLQFADTVDNFLKSDDSDNNSPVKPEDFDFLRINITAKNGFPLGVSTSIILYDSATQVHKYTIDATDILSPAPVDINGKVTSPIDCETSIDITKDFWDSIDLADKIIFIFKMNSTDNGSKDVKIYSDYKINFKASLVLKPDIRFDLK
jgi:hypothetical protein